MFQEFVRPATVSEALELARRLGEDGVFLAGGTALNAKGSNPRATVAIGLDRLGLDRLEVLPDGVRLGAGLTLQALLERPEVPAPLRVASRQMVNRNLRNMATLGGNVALARSCSSMLPVLVALDATLEIATLEGERLVPAAEWIAGPRRDLVVAVRLGGERLRWPVAQRRVSRTANDLSIVSVAVSARLAGGVLGEPRVAVGGVSRLVVRLGAVEQALGGKAPPTASVVEELVGREVSPVDDLRGSAAYKRHLAAALVHDCLGRLGAEKCA